MAVCVPDHPSSLSSYPNMPSGGHQSRLIDYVVCVCVFVCVCPVCPVCLSVSVLCVRYGRMTKAIATFIRQKGEAGVSWGDIVDW